MAACMNMIVPEVLKDFNYERWRIFMEHYLVAQDLWDVVQSIEMPQAEDPRNWVKKNALALLAIKISCGEKSFDQIKKKNLAQDAWNALADLHKQPNGNASRGSETDPEVEETCARILDHNERTAIVSSLSVGNWDALRNLDRITELFFPGGFTILHIATIAGHLNIVNELVRIKREDEDYMRAEDDNGDTALSLAACNGEVEIAECLVQNKDILLTIPNKNGYIPLVVACINGQKDMTSYLYSVTPFDFLLSEEGKHGALFLKYCALNFMLDVGLDLYLRCPSLAARRESISISELSVQPSLFLSGSSLNHPVDLFLYKCLDVVELPSPSHDPSEYKLKIFKRKVAGVKRMDRILGPFFALYHRITGSGKLKDMYNVKLTHRYANLILRCWCQEISTDRDATQLVKSGAISVIFQAIKDGTNEIVIEILKVIPDLIWCNEKLSRDILISAIKYRRRCILRFVYRHDAGKKALLSLSDQDGNNALHLVAKLPDRCASGDADFYAPSTLKREEKWFEEVKGYLPGWYHEARNLYGETPVQVFRREHYKLTNETVEWIKKAAKSYSIASVLIITIMFAALFTVPGGNDEKTGMPILLHRNLFSGFLIADVFSFLTASASLLLFLSVLAVSDGRGAAKGLLLWQMVFAVCALVISIVTMILAFIFAGMLLLENKWQRLLTPIIVYLLLLFFSIMNVWVLPIILWVRS